MKEPFNRETEMNGMSHTAIRNLIAGATIAVMVLSGCVSAPKYVVEDGRIVVDSPFDLEIGSTEYAKALGGKVHTSVHANYDPKTKTTTTNWYHSAEARLTTPYFGSDTLWLSFKGEGKELDHCDLSIRGAAGKGGMLSYSECREAVGKIAADMGKRLGITMQCRDDKSEEAAKESVRESVEQCRRRAEKFSDISCSFIGFTGEKTVKNVKVDYSVRGMINMKGRCDIHVSYFKHREFAFSTWKPGDAIPVYTNEMFSASSGKLVPTKEQKRAHDEAKGLRETVNRLFGIDLDKPAETNEILSALWTTNVQALAKREWMPLATPFEGMTERKINKSVCVLAVPFVTFALRHPFDGDVTDSELKAQAKRFLERLEKEYGTKIPEVDPSEGTALLAKVFGEGVPTFGDTRALLGLDKTLYFTGKVGDLAVDISYAPPRYAKKDGRFEVACRGAVVVNIVQSPVVTTGKTKTHKGNASR